MKPIYLFAGLAALAILFLAAFFRYETTPAGNGMYKTDRWTGHTVHIIGSRISDPKPARFDPSTARPE